jgi:hypothetical protein
VIYFEVEFFQKKGVKMRHSLVIIVVLMMMFYILGENAQRGHWNVPVWMIAHLSDAAYAGEWASMGILLSGRFSKKHLLIFTFSRWRLLNFGYVGTCVGVMWEVFADGQQDPVDILCFIGSFAVLYY